jgi:hypothetical protein
MTLEHLRSRKLRSAPVPGSRGETAPGEMSEWLKEHAWKACMRKRIEGSNPSLSASFRGFEADARGRPRDDGEAVSLFGDRLGIVWGCSSVGRAPRSQRGGQRFDPAHLHIFTSGSSVIVASRSTFDFKRG